jgi:hypothetical protein
MELQNFHFVPTYNVVNITLAERGYLELSCGSNKDYDLLSFRAERKGRHLGKSDLKIRVIQPGLDQQGR